MGSRRVIHSVGIDIGTTTTQVIFSELELVNRASISQVPHYEFARRDIMYVSPVMFTPLDNTEHVRESELGQFIRDQYKQAGLKTKVTPVTTEEYGLSVAARPTNSRLDKSKLDDAGFKRLPAWQDAVGRYLAEKKQFN